MSRYPQVVSGAAILLERQAHDDRVPEFPVRAAVLLDPAAFLGLSTVRQPLGLSGSQGARRLCSLLRGERVRPLRQELSIELVARGSSASYRAVKTASVRS